ncbi:hypothetical protein [Bradyrhizobium sp. NAS96.2]|uniref:hypothetical protein n=1 Tax=Bradyrhizobium sp. NAS96.2 TaxID=1680160 RepID=UPI0011614956|nr:hypothetical protein [Bradyrhizobium sp. NAS96.2]
MFGDVLRNITSGAVSLALNDRPISGSERRRIIATRSSYSPTSGTRGPKSNGMAAARQIDAHLVAHKKHRNYKCLERWSEWQDSNLRPLRPERNQRSKKSTKSMKLDPD